MQTFVVNVVQEINRGDHVSIGGARIFLKQVQKFVLESYYCC